MHDCGDAVSLENHRNAVRRGHGHGQGLSRDEESVTLTAGTGLRRVYHLGAMHLGHIGPFGRDAKFGCNRAARFVGNAEVAFGSPTESLPL